MMITVVSKMACPWCDRVKVLLRQQGLPHDERCLDTPAAQADFARKHNITTFPQVFAGANRIGGFEDTRDWIARGGHLS